MGGRSRRVVIERIEPLPIDKFKELRNIDLFTVASSLGLEFDPNDKKQLIGDGHRISINGDKFNDFNSGKGGGGAIDLVMHVKDLDFQQACNFLGYIDYTSVAAVARLHDKKPSELPVRAYDTSRARDYLITQRGLNPDLVDSAIKSGKVWQDLKGNAVFDYGEGVELRGTGSETFKGFRGTKGNGFVIDAVDMPFRVVVVESSIDALSYKQLHDSNDLIVAIGGDANDKFMQYAIDQAKAAGVPLVAAFDNDQGGDIARSRLRDIFDNHLIWFDVPISKDWNEDLILSNKYHVHKSDKGSFYTSNDGRSYLYKDGQFYSKSGRAAWKLNDSIEFEHGLPVKRGTFGDRPILLNIDDAPIYDIKKIRLPKDKK